MIQDLLWRCPACAAPDSLVHRQPWIGPQVLDCRQCACRWQVRRAPGDGFYLRVTRPPAHLPAWRGLEKPLSAWYDQMKSTLALHPITDPGAPLEPGENLYLASLPAERWDTDPAAGEATEAPHTLASQGRLFLCERRLLWAGAGETLSLPLSAVLGAYTVLNWGMAAAVLPPDQPGAPRLYLWRFPQESPLKWVTYLALIAPRIRQESGRQIKTSHF